MPAVEESSGVVGTCNEVAVVPPPATNSAMLAPAPEGLGAIASALMRMGFSPNKTADSVAQADQLWELMCESVEEVGTKYSVEHTAAMAAN